VCEITATAARTAYAGAQATPEEALATFRNYSGFWGTYRADPRDGRITYRAEAGVNPNLIGQELVRTYVLNGDQLTMTSTAGVAARLVWTRVPPIEGSSPSHRRLYGFWRQMTEHSVGTATGAVLSEVKRGPSVIAYTPSGFVCVHFPRADRARFASDTPTPDEAKAALTGYTSYVAALAVHPGFIFHHQLTTLAPAPATSLQRFFEFVKNDQEVIYRFPPTTAGGVERRTQVVLRRLSGAADMVP
jgi:hypothetical protein